MSTSEIFLIALTIILAVPYAFWRLLRTDHYAPLVVVQIVGGIILGPGVLGAAFPGYYAFVFNPQVIGALNGVAWWAVMMFVFTAGLELDLGDALDNWSETAITARCSFRCFWARVRRRFCCSSRAGSGPRVIMARRYSASAWPAPSLRSLSLCC